MLAGSPVSLLVHLCGSLGDLELPDQIYIYIYAAHANVRLSDSLEEGVGPNELHWHGATEASLHMYGDFVFLCVLLNCSHANCVLGHSNTVCFFKSVD